MWRGFIRRWCKFRGSGYPTKPGKPGDFETPADGEKGDSKDNEIWLPAPVEDDCNGLHRKLQFLNNVTREPIEKKLFLNMHSS